MHPRFVTDEGQIWRLVTYPLVPGSLLLFAIATVVLLWFGRALELRIGRWRYLMLCVLPSIAAAVVNLFLPDPDGTKLPLASPHFMSSGIALAALSFAVALRQYHLTSLKTWIIGLATAYYLYAILVAPRDLLAMNLIVFLVAGVVVFRQVRNARAA
jgi:membrane associated rhomboid family serine protease